MFRTTKRLTVLSLATAAFAATFGVASAYSPESDGDRARQMCAQQSLTPGSTPWELCVSHVTRAFEWDELGLAKQMAREARRASESCRYLGARPETPNFSACVGREIQRHSELNILGDDRSGVNVAMQQ